MSDLDSAIIHLHDALKYGRSPRDDRQMGLFAYLGRCLLHRHRYSGAISVLDEAVLQLEKAVEMSYSVNTSPSARQNVVNDLCNVLTLRFQQTGSASDINRAIQLCRQPFEELPRNHELRNGAVWYFAQVLFAQALRTREPRYLEEAILLLREFVDNHPIRDPDDIAVLDLLTQCLLHHSAVAMS